MMVSVSANFQRSAMNGLLGLTLLLGPFHAQAEDFRLWLGSRSSSRQQYELDLTRLVLESTKPEFGEYSIETDYSPLSPQRRYLQTDSDDLIDIVIQPYHLKRGKTLQYIPIPVMKGLLGIRQIITTQSNLRRLSTAETLEQLRHYRVGQGLAWLEVNLFRKNDFKVIEAPYKNLFAMLVRDRFDILPIGASEINKTLLDQLAKYPELVIVPDLVMYYPHPVFFYVDKNSKRSIKRIENGIKIIINNGSLESLFNKHFDEVVRDLISSKQRLLVLSNPVLTTELKNTIDISLVKRLSEDKQ